MLAIILISWLPYHKKHLVFTLIPREVEVVTTETLSALGSIARGYGISESGESQRTGTS